MLRASTFWGNHDQRRCPNFAEKATLASPNLKGFAMSGQPEKLARVYAEMMDEVERQACSRRGLGRFPLGPLRQAVSVGRCASIVGRHAGRECGVIEGLQGRLECVEPS